MGSRILLYSVNQYDFPYPVFPLGITQVETALRKAGHRTRLVDYNLECPPVETVVQEFQPDFVGISLRNIDDALIKKQETFFASLTELCADLRRHTAARIVLGGSGFSIFPELLLELSGAEFGIQGEGESQLVALIQALNNGSDYSSVSGLVHRRQDRIVVNSRTHHESPQAIPVAERSSSLTEHYLKTSSMLNLQTQRGCALRCCYCTYPLLEGRHYRRRPAEAVVEELEQMTRAGARYVFVVDSLFNTSAAHVAEICEAILQRNVKVQWCCFLRPQNLTFELMRLMARAGLTHVEFGSDSFCDSVLDAYGKGLTFEDILHSSDCAVRANVDYAHFLICGGPGETPGTLEMSFTNSRRLNNATIMARLGMRVYPGTPLHERLVQERGPDSLPDLLQPYYYVSPDLNEEQVFARLEEVAQEMPNWIFNDPPEEYQRMAERLRARGVVGPLWSYFSILQRLGNLSTVGN